MTSLQADRRQPPQCLKEHRAENRRRQAPLPPQCRAPWLDRRDSDRRTRGCRRLQSLRSSHYSRLRRPISGRAGIGATARQPLWRLRRATTIEAGLFEIQAEHLSDLIKDRQFAPLPRQILCPIFSNHRFNPIRRHQRRSLSGNWKWNIPVNDQALRPIHLLDLARCFLRLANLPNCALDRLSRYEAALWRQVGQTLVILDALDRRKPCGRFRMLDNKRRLLSDMS